MWNGHKGIKMNYMRNVRKQYLISLFHSLILAYVIERLFWQQRGMNVQMVVYAEIIYAMTVTIFEIPSGILSDRFGRKKMLVFDSILGVLELLLLVTAHDFWQFALAVFMAGIGKALSSGSENALLYDSLLISGRQDDFEKYLGRISAIDFAGSVVAALSGSVLANFLEYEFNYFVSIGSMFMAFVICFTLREPPMLTKPEHELSNMKQYARQSLAVFKSQPLVLTYCLTGAVLGSCLIYIDEFWQIVVENIGIPVLFFGIISAVGLSIRIPGNLFAYKLKERFKYRSILSCIIAVSAVGYMAIFLTRNVFFLIPMTAIFFASGITEPLVSGYLHHHTESNVRATVESFSSLGLRVVSSAIGFAFGYVSTRYSIFEGFMVLGIVCVAYLVMFRVVGRRHPVE